VVILSAAFLLAPFGQYFWLKIRGGVDALAAVEVIAHRPAWLVLGLIILVQLGVFFLYGFYSGRRPSRPLRNVVATT
jgi:hypothetical protein